MKCGRNAQERFDIEVIGGKDNLKQHLLINRYELLVPFVDVGGALAGLVLVGFGVGCGERLATMVLAVFENLSKIMSRLRNSPGGNTNNSPS